MSQLSRSDERHIQGLINWRRQVEKPLAGLIAEVVPRVQPRKLTTSGRNTGILYADLTADLSTASPTGTFTFVRACDGKTDYPTGAGAITAFNQISGVSPPAFIHSGKIGYTGLLAWDSVNDEYSILAIECEPISINVYNSSAGPLPATITPGTTARLNLALAAEAINPKFIIVTGNELEAIEDFTAPFGTAIRTQYVSAANNTEIQIEMEMVSTFGTGAIVQTRLRDPFTSPRVGTFDKTHALPSGFIQLSAGDRIAFDITNLPVSTMDLDITSYRINLSAT